MPDHTTFTVAELARLWNCSADIIYDLLRSGRLQGFRLGSSWRISDEARRAYEQTPHVTDRPQLRGTGKRIYKIT